MNSSSQSELRQRDSSEFDTDSEFGADIKPRRTSSRISSRTTSDGSVPSASVTLRSSPAPSASSRGSSCLTMPPSDALETVSEAEEPLPDEVRATRRSPTPSDTDSDEEALHLWTESKQFKTLPKLNKSRSQLAVDSVKQTAKHSHSWPGNTSGSSSQQNNPPCLTRAHASRANPLEVDRLIDFPKDPFPMTTKVIFNSLQISSTSAMTAEIVNSLSASLSLSKRSILLINKLIVFIPI